MLVPGGCAIAAFACVVQVMNEIDVLRRAGRHPYLVNFRGYFRDGEGLLCLVMGYCQGGTLSALIKVRASVVSPTCGFTGCAFQPCLSLEKTGIAVSSVI